MTQKYIGGNFSSTDILPYLINPSRTQVLEYFPEFLNASYRNYFETGTDALAAIIKEIEEYYLSENIIIWFPEHYCQETISKLKLKTGLGQIIKYNGVEHIQVSEKSLHIIVLLHFNRYSLSINNEIAFLNKYDNILIIEDFVQCPFEIKLFKGDYAFNSLRKVLNIDISVAYVKKKYSSASSESKYHTLKQEATRIKTEFITTNNTILEKKYLKLFKESEESLLEDKTIRLVLSDEMDKLNCINFKSIIERRRENFLALKKLLDTCVQVQILDGDYFFLMLKCEKRDILKSALFDKNVFAPIHWIDTDSVLSQQLLSIPIDQRYNISDLKEISAAIIQFYGK